MIRDTASPTRVAADTAHDKLTARLLPRGFKILPMRGLETLLPNFCICRCYRAHASETPMWPRCDTSSVVRGETPQSQPILVHEKLEWKTSRDGGVYLWSDVRKVQVNRQW